MAHKSIDRLHRGRNKLEAIFPVAPAASNLPESYAQLLSSLKTRIRQERMRVVLSNNAALVNLYWNIGKSILKKQDEEGWGAKVIDRLSADLSKEFSDMKGFSPRNLKYMRAFASAWPKKTIVQEVLAQITWYHNLALLDKLDDAQVRLWYAHKTIEHGWSRNILAVQIDLKLHERQGKAAHITSKSLYRVPPASPTCPHYFPVRCLTPLFKLSYKQGSGTLVRPLKFLVLSRIRDSGWLGFSEKSPSLYFKIVCNPKSPANGMKILFENFAIPLRKAHGMKILFKNFATRHLDSQGAKINNFCNNFTPFSVIYSRDE